MREILFKAKRKDNGEWIKGYYFCMTHNDEQDHVHHFLIPLGVDLSKGRKIEEIQIEVDPDTVCYLLSKEYDIWEHDIVIIAGEGEDVYFEVEWNDDTQRFEMNGYGVSLDFDNCSLHDLRVEGNRFDTPDLIWWNRS